MIKYIICYFFVAILFFGLALNDIILTKEKNNYPYLTIIIFGFFCLIWPIIFLYIMINSILNKEKNNA